MSRDFIFSKEKKILLDAVAATGLPILIDGKIATGKSYIGSYLRASAGKFICDPMEPGSEVYTDSNTELSLDSLLERTDLSNLVIVQGTRMAMPLERSLEEFVKIQCFKPIGSAECCIKMSLIKSDFEQLNDKLSPEAPVILVVGKNSENIKHKYILENGIDTVDLHTAEQLDNLIKLVNGRIGELQLLSRTIHHSEKHFPEKHFTISVHSIEALGYTDSIVSLLRTIRISGVMLTLYSNKTCNHPRVFNDYASNVIFI